MRFGSLTAIEFAGYRQETRQKVSCWLCRCDCGNTCEVPAYILTSGRRKSCGCSRKNPEDRIGGRYGKLTVLDIDRDNTTTQVKLLCRCDCGTVKSIALRDLRSGKVTSCGCDRAVKAVRKEFPEQVMDESKEDIRRAFVGGDISGIRTLDDWIYIWIREVAMQAVKLTTVRMYADTLAHHVQPYIGDIELAVLKEEVIRRWMNQMREQYIIHPKDSPMTEGTLRNILSVLSGCLRDACKYRLLEENPCADVAWVAKRKNLWEEKEWLDEEDLTVLEPFLEAYQTVEGYPLGIGYQLVLYAGLTLSEAVALRWRDVDFEHRRISVRYFAVENRKMPEFQVPVSGGTGKRYIQNLEETSGRRKRKIPIPSFLNRRLQSLQERYHAKPEDFVLQDDDGQPVQTDRMRAALIREGKASGLKHVTPRSLRDTYAMRAVRAGASSDVIAELMGFSSTRQVIRRYMPNIASDKEELVERMCGRK